MNGRGKFEENHAIYCITWLIEWILSLQLNGAMRKYGPLVVFEKSEVSFFRRFR